MAGDDNPKVQRRRKKWQRGGAKYRVIAQGASGAIIGGSCGSEMEKCPRIDVTVGGPVKVESVTR